MVACRSMDITFVNHLRSAAERLFQGGALLAAYASGARAPAIRGREATLT